jgi:hypothetical protein
MSKFFKKRRIDLLGFNNKADDTETLERFKDELLEEFLLDYREALEREHGRT